MLTRIFKCEWWPPAQQRVLSSRTRLHAPACRAPQPCCAVGPHSETCTLPTAHPPTPACPDGIHVDHLNNFVADYTMDNLRCAPHNVRKKLTK